MTQGPKTVSIEVNIILKNQLEPLLTQWWRSRVRFAEMARRINAMVKAEADLSGAPSREYSSYTVRIWCRDVYRLQELT